MTTRRGFLKDSSALVAGAAFSPFMLPGAGVSANDKISVALIGCKGMGMYDLKDHLRLPEVECVALCDVDQKILSERAAEVNKISGKTPKMYKDFRQVLDDKTINAIIIGTPDHWHCLIAVMAMQVGKDVYVEKPLANSIAECEIMLAAARKYSKVVQVGQQQRSGQHWQDIVAFVRSGKLGTIRKVKTWANFDYAKGSPKINDEPVPPGVDYDLWLGPSPKTAFNKNRFHGSWRMFWNQGGGLQTDWGVHLLDIPLLAMNAAAPISVSAAGGIFAYPENYIETPDTQSTVYDFGHFILEWEHGAGLTKGIYGRNYGVAFIGTNGTLVVNREGWEVIPESDNDKPRMEATPLQSADPLSHEKHVKNFIDCLKSRNRPACDIEFGRNSAVLAHMGNIAVRTGRKLKWDDVHKNFGSDTEANAMIKPSYRDPWTFPVI